MSASQIRAAAAVDIKCPWCSASPGQPCHYRDGTEAGPHAQRHHDAYKAEREQAAAERLAAWEAEHGKLRPIRRGRR